MPSGRLDLANRFQHFFWMGDLNYRVDLDRSKVLEHVQKCEWAELMLADQLRAQQQSGAALSDFREGTITFAPTFKHVPGAEVEPGTINRPYETKKMRVPSYCDRVLWRSWPGSRKRVSLLDYNAVTACTTSDHTPVRAIFDLDISTPRVAGEAHESFLGKVDLVLFDLKAQALKSMDINGLADPYLRASADFHVEPRTSSVKRKTLSPSWVGEEIRLRVPHYRCWRSHIEEAHIFLEIVDEDKYSKHDFMGGGVLSCENVLNEEMRSRSTKATTTAPTARRFSTSGGVTRRVSEPFRSGAMQFQINLTFDGKPAGTLTGKIRADVTPEKGGVLQIASRTNDAEEGKSEEGGTKRNSKRTSTRKSVILDDIVQRVFKTRKSAAREEVKI